MQALAQQPKLSEARISEIYRAFAHDPTPENAQAVIEAPGMPVQYLKLAHKYTKQGKQVRAEQLRVAAATSLRALLQLGDVLTAAQKDDFEIALFNVNAWERADPFLVGREIAQDQQIKQFCDNTGRGN